TASIVRFTSLTEPSTPAVATRRIAFTARAGRATPGTRSVTRITLRTVDSCPTPTRSVTRSTASCTSALRPRSRFTRTVSHAAPLICMRPARARTRGRDPPLPPRHLRQARSVRRAAPDRDLDIEPEATQIAPASILVLDAALDGGDLRQHAGVPSSV